MCLFLNVSSHPLCWVLIVLTEATMEACEASPVVEYQGGKAPCC